MRNIANIFRKIFSSSIIHRLLYGPVSKDPARSREVLFTHQISALSAFSLLVQSLLALNRLNWADFFAFVLGVIILSAILIFNYIKQNKRAAAMLLIYMLLSVTFSLYSGPNVTRLVALLCYPCIIFFAGLLLARRPFFIVLVFAVAVLSVSFMFASENKLGIRMGANITETQIVGSILLLIVMGIFARGVSSGIRENEERFRKIFYDSTDPVLLIDGSGYFDCNRAALQQLQLSSVKDIVGKFPWDVSPTFQRDGRPSLERGRAIAASIADNEQTLFEWMFQRRDGSVFDVEVSLSNSTLNNRPIIISTWRDITERRRAEAEALSARRELMRMERLHHMGELTASLAHELNQPLTAILNNVRAALRSIESEKIDIGELKELLEDVAQDDKRAGNIIKSLRNMVKPENSEREEVSINDVVGEAVSLFNSEAILRNIKMEVKLADALPYVTINKVQIQQLLINLMMNAAESMQGGTKNRRIIITVDRLENSAVCVSVRDFGHGVEEKYLNTVFDPFFTTKQSGMGMGLALGRSIMEAHRGQLTVENNRDRGATFSFHLPTEEE